MARMSETQVAEDEIAAHGIENHCSVLILDRFEAGSRGIRDLLLYSRELSLSHFRRNGRTDRQIEIDSGLWCPSTALVMRCDGCLRHRARRRGVHRRYAFLLTRGGRYHRHHARRCRSGGTGAKVMGPHRRSPA